MSEESGFKYPPQVSAFAADMMQLIVVQSEANLQFIKMIGKLRAGETVGLDQYTASLDAAKNVLAHVSKINSRILTREADDGRG